MDALLHQSQDAEISTKKSGQDNDMSSEKRVTSFDDDLKKVDGDEIKMETNQKDTSSFTQKSGKSILKRRCMLPEHEKFQTKGKTDGAPKILFRTSQTFKC